MGLDPRVKPEGDEQRRLRVTANVVVIAGLDSAWLYWPARLQCPYGHTTNGHTQASAVRATARQASRGMTRRREWGLGMMNAE